MKRPIGGQLDEGTAVNKRVMDMAEDYETAIIVLERNGFLEQAAALRPLHERAVRIETYASELGRIFAQYSGESPSSGHTALGSHIIDKLVKDGWTPPAELAP